MKFSVTKGHHDMYSSEQLEPSLLVWISRRELLDFFSQYQRVQKKDARPGMIRSFLHMTGLYQTRGEQIIRPKRPWFDFLQAIIQENSASEYLEPDVLFQLFLLLRRWDSPENLTEEIFVSTLIYRFDAPLKGAFWKFLCMLDDAGIFSAVPVEMKAAEEEFLEVEDGSWFFRKIMLFQPEYAGCIEFFATALVQAAGQGGWPKEILQSLFKELLQQNLLWFAELKEAWPDFEKEAPNDPEFWKDCFAFDGISQRLVMSRKKPVFPVVVPQFKQGSSGIAQAHPPLLVPYSLLWLHFHSKKNSDRDFLFPPSHDNVDSSASIR